MDAHLHSRARSPGAAGWHAAGGLVTGPALDRARVAAVVRGTPTSVAQFLAEFRRTTERDADQLLGAARAGQPAQLAHFAHRIEGACLMIGAARLAAACSVLAAGCAGAGELDVALAAFIASKQALYECMEPDGARSDASSLAAADAMPMCAGLVFLVVEDHEFQRAVILRLLRQLGAAQVQGFADGAEALQAARSLPPAGAILILDLGLPSLSGPEVARIAGAERLPLALILHSAQPEERLAEAIAQARSHGAIVLGALAKPLAAARLAPLVALHRNRLAAQAPASPDPP